MGQSAGLYRIDKAGFQQISENPAEINPWDVAKGHQSFDKSFEGLRFVLSKNQREEIGDLVQQIFYPQTFMGEEIDFNTIDMENIPDDFDFDSTAIYYHPPSKVTEIASFLETIGVEKFKTLFNPDELNQQDIYPGDVWNRDARQDRAFNETHMADELVNLKELFNSAANEGDYVFCVIE